MASIKKHVANFADHERVETYKQLTNAMEHVSSTLDAIELIAMDMSDEATNARFTLYQKLHNYLDSVALFAGDLHESAIRAKLSITVELENRGKRAEYETK